MFFPDKFDTISGKRRYFRYSVEDRCISSYNLTANFITVIFSELGQQQLKELETQRNRLDQETSAKLAELNNR